MERSEDSPSASLPALFLALGLFVLLSGKLSFWSEDGFEFFGNSGTVVALCIFAALLTALPGVISGKGIRLSPISFAMVIVALFFSDWLCRGYNLLQGPTIRGEIILGSLISAFLLTSSKRALMLSGLLVPVGLAVAFLTVSDGRIVFSDDHPVFLYRLMLLRENFPFIPFFNPLWNGGVDARDFFATGSLNVFFILAPLVYSLDLLTQYQYLLTALLFLVVPAALILAARVEGLSWNATAIAVSFGLCGNLLWYRWALKYGTLGFICSAALIPLVFTLVSRTLAAPAQVSKRLAVGLVCAATLMLFWSLTGLIFLPLILAALCSLPALIRQKRIRRIMYALVAINLPWILLFVTVSRVFSFLDSSTGKERRIVYGQPADHLDPKATTVHKDVPKGKARTALRTVREWAVSSQPLVLFLGIPGLALLSRARRRHLLLTLAWTLFLGSYVAAVKPQLELDRMLLVFGLLLVIPASLALEQLFVSAAWRTAKWRFLVTSMCGGFFLAAPFSTTGILMNRSIEQYFFAGPQVASFSEALKVHGGEGRIVFSGFVLHQLNEGHLAPLVFSSGQKLVASSFAHDKWRYTDVIPADFRAQGDPGIERFLDLHNATAVVAHEKRWIAYFRERPEKYQEVWHAERFHIFRRTTAASNYFVEGSGEILNQTSNRVEFRLDHPEALLKFNYFPFLQVPGCELEPAQMGETITLIRLKGCPVGRTLTLYSLPAWYRFWRN